MNILSLSGGKDSVASYFLCRHEIDCIIYVDGGVPNRGNAIKYIWRAGDKGNEVEDLQKALWYIHREIERVEKEKK